MIAIIAVLGAVVVPSAARVRSSLAGGEGARRLALVLRTAQARAQMRAAPVRVAVLPDGEYLVSDVGGGRAQSGRLGAEVSSTYPSGVVEFTPWGWPRVPGSTSPRAGHFTLSGGAASCKVTLQISGCVRCV